MKNPQTTAAEVFNEIKEGLFEDRLEYDLHELKTCYPELSELEVSRLYLLLNEEEEYPINHGKFEEVFKDADAEKLKACFLEYFLEGQHNNFDGWEELEKRTLSKVMEDFKISFLNS